GWGIRRDRYSAKVAASQDILATEVYLGRVNLDPRTTRRRTRNKPDDRYHDRKKDQRQKAGLEDISASTAGVKILAIGRRPKQEVQIVSSREGAGLVANRFAQV